ncbi:MAG: right-handed parallel beta-helix repeat-containing protein [Candidatus Heimdallarchaeaceae archaeon]
MLSFSRMSINATTVSTEPPSYSSLISHDSIEISSDSDFEVFPGLGTAGDPYLIEGYNITTTDSTGIHITDTTKYFTIRNCYVEANDYGIYIDTVVAGTAIVISNNCTNNNLRGIYIYESSSSTITNNTCSNNGEYGIYLGDSISSTVVGNTCNFNNLYGIYIDSSGGSTVSNNLCSYNNYGLLFYWSVNSDVINNICSNNDVDGIYLYASTSSTVSNNTCSYNNGDGIFLEYSGLSTVIYNTCNNNNNRGIFLYDSACDVIYNILYKNVGYGVYLSGSDSDLVHHNNFVANNLGGPSQANDDGSNHFWYDTVTLEGNYWSDWSGTGTYAIDGSAGSVDLYPLVEPTMFLGPPDITAINHSPSTPTELDTITIDAIVTSPHGVQSVALHYRVNSGTWIEVSMTFVSGDLYSVTIGSFAVGDTIEYYLSALDNSIDNNAAIEDNEGLYYTLLVVSSGDPPTYPPLTPHDPIVITSDIDFEVFPGSGTAEDPYLIEGWNITTTYSEGIHIQDTTKYFIIRNCYVEAGETGIYNNNVAAGTGIIENNTCSNNHYGIRFYYSPSSTIVTNNTCNNNKNGISFQYSGYSTIANNTCSYNDEYGIRLDDSGNSTISGNICNYNAVYDGIYLWYSGSSIVTLNTCYHNKEYGIYLDHSGSSTVSHNIGNNDYGIGLFDSGYSTASYNSFDNSFLGIYLVNSDFSTVFNNEFSENHHYGIKLDSSSSCSLSYNNLQNNQGYGIGLFSLSSSNTIHHNNFVYNNYGVTSQGRDDVTNNVWYDTATLEGNYWDDWSGTGSYAIDGAAGAIDLYPLDEPTVFFLGPLVITDIIHSPSSPTELDPVSISATVRSHHGVQSVALQYRVNSGTWIEVSMTLVSGDLYSVIIDPFVVNDIVEYYLTAVDNSVDHNEVMEDNDGQYFSIAVGPSDVIGPSITDIIHSPTAPTEKDVVSIRARVTDANGVQSATLHYRVNSGTWMEVSMTLQSGDLYSVAIGSYAVDETIEYYISASDNSVNHNLAINDNSGAYYSFAILADGGGTIAANFPLLPSITFLFLAFGIVVHQRRKS